jgi:hypothetical protein
MSFRGAHVLEAQNVINVVEELSYLNACYFVLAFACGGFRGCWLFTEKR